jgi:hypothetical protein
MMGNSRLAAVIHTGGCRGRLAATHLESTSMHLFRSLSRRFRRQDIDLETEAEAKTLESDRLSIRISQAAGSPSSSAGLVTPTPGVLHPDEDER